MGVAHVQVAMMKKLSFLILQCHMILNGKRRLIVWKFPIPCEVEDNRAETED